MPFFMIDDGAAFHSKLVAAGNASVGLWTRAGAWSQQPQNLTEGFIPKQIARTIGTAGQIRKLIEVGLWFEVEGGYQFHEWDQRQMSRAEIEERRRKRTAAGRAGGIRSGYSRRSKNEASASEEAKQNGTETEAESNQDRTPVLVPEEISTQVEISPPVSQRAGKPRGSRAYVDRINATARSAPAHQIAVAFSNSLSTPIESGLLGKVGVEIDKCLNSGIPPKLIADGLTAWSVSDSWSPTQIPNFVHKAATSRGRVGRSKPTERVLDASQAAEELLREVTTRD